MSTESLIIPKRPLGVVLWVHPEGRVIGSLFVRSDLEERPVDVLNHARSFIVLRRDDPVEIRFYHRSSIIRLEHDDRPQKEEDKILHRCVLHMMDGSIIEGTLARPSPPDRSRLFDFLNREEESFLEIFPDEGPTVLVNKSYVVFVRAAGEE